MYVVVTVPSNHSTAKDSGPLKWIATTSGSHDGGPPAVLRTTIPAAFQMANIGSAVVWIPVLIVPGAAVTILVDEFRSGNETIAVLIGLLLGAVILGAVVAVRRYAPRILGNGRPDGGG